MPRYQRVDKPVDLPPFLQKVIASLEPVPPWALDDSSRLQTVSHQACHENVEQEVTSQNWLLLKREGGNPIEARRRIRGKMSVRKMEGEGGEDLGDGLKKERAKVQRMMESKITR